MDRKLCSSAVSDKETIEDALNCEKRSKSLENSRKALVSRPQVVVLGGSCDIEINIFERSSFPLQRTLFEGEVAKL